MAPMPALKRVGEPYPPQCSPQFFEFLLRMSLSDERDEHGNFLLQRSLSPREQCDLRERGAALLPWLTPGAKDDIVEIVNQMLLGFAAPTSSEEESAVTVIQYQQALAGLPLWAVERACMRFARNEVADEELGKGQRWSRSFGPTTAHLQTVARDLVAPFAKESKRIKMTLNGTPMRRPVSAAERARGDAAVAAWLAQSGARQKQYGEEARAAREAQRKVDTRIEEGQQELVRREYRAAGIDPPEALPGKLVPSLSVMLQLGWTVEDHPDGGRMMIGPARAPRDDPPPPETRPEQRASGKPIGDVARAIVGAK